MTDVGRLVAGSIRKGSEGVLVTNVVTSKAVSHSAGSGLEYKAFTRHG